MELAVAILMLGTGAVTVFSGFTGQPIVGTLKSVLAGNKPGAGGSGESKGSGSSGLPQLLAPAGSGITGQGRAPGQTLVTPNPDPIVAPGDYGNWYGAYIDPRGTAGTAATNPLVGVPLPQPTSPPTRAGGR